MAVAPQQIVDVSTNIGMVGILAGVWANIIPSLVSIVTLVWFCIKIYESPTVKTLIKRIKKILKRKKNDNA